MKVEVNLSEMMDGSVQKLFEKGAEEVIANMKDALTSHKRARKLSMIFKFSPTEDRKGAIMEVDMKTELAPQVGATSQLWFEGATAEERQPDMAETE